jgi:hypothetical protein
VENFPAKNMWAELRKTYELTGKANAYFDTYKYLSRVHKKHPRWKWPGRNSGKWRPPTTQPSDEIISPLKSGTKFTVTDILYQAVSRGMKYQAVEALLDNSMGWYDQRKVDKTGFIWIWHKDEQFFKEVEKKKEKKEEEETEWVRHDLKDEELNNGFNPHWQKEYELVFPVFRISIDKQNIFPLTQGIESIENDNRKRERINKDDAVLKLVGKENNGETRYIHSIKLKDAVVKSNQCDQFVHVDFQGTPRGDDVKYTLEIDPGSDENGNKREKYISFTDVTYTETFSRNR